MKLNILQVLGHTRLRNIVLAGCGACLLVWLILITYLYDSDPCKGKLYTTYLCDQYTKGIVSGSLCPKLCANKKKIVLNNCIREERGQTVFRWDEMEIKANSKYFQPDYSQLMREELYQKPEKGKSMAEFRSMILEFLDAKLGVGDHSGLVAKVMDTADVNSDGKVSLAEAKTIWALLQHNDFFVGLVFRTCEHIPAVTHFCGDTYMVESVQFRYLYDKNEDSWMASIFPSHYRWMMPRWHHRAKIMVGLLEFTLEAFQHSSAGAFYFCDTSESNIGYNMKHEMKLSDTINLLPKHELKLKLAGHLCQSESDCVYTRQCTTVCDSESQTCTEDIVRPNLHLVCQLMRDYVLDDSPTHIYPEFITLLERCDKLSYVNNTNTDIEHSLIVNDLKSLLWKQIDYQ